MCLKLIWAGEEQGGWVGGVQKLRSGVKEQSKGSLIKKSSWEEYEKQREYIGILGKYWATF